MSSADDQKPIRLPADDDKLLDECEVTVHRGSSPGGQHANTSDSAVRLEHLPTGIIVRSQATRSQHRNRQDCLRKLREVVRRRNQRRRKRVPTRPSRAARQRRLDAKRRRSEKKGRRQPPRRDE